jgi:hypothetical protein
MIVRDTDGAFDNIHYDVRAGGGIVLKRPAARPDGRSLPTDFRTGLPPLTK